MHAHTIPLIRHSAIDMDFLPCSRRCRLILPQNYFLRGNFYMDLMDGMRVCDFALDETKGTFSFTGGERSLPATLTSTLLGLEGGV